MLNVQGNIAGTYQVLDMTEQALHMHQDVYSGFLKLNGIQHAKTLGAANNYAACLIKLQRLEEAKALLRKIIPATRRILGESGDDTLRLRWLYAQALYKDDGATPDDLREAVKELEDTERIARRVLGRSHPLAEVIGGDLDGLRAAIENEETPLSSGSAQILSIWSGSPPEGIRHVSLSSQNTLPLPQEPRRVPEPRRLDVIARLPAAVIDIYGEGPQVFRRDRRRRAALRCIGKVAPPRPEVPDRE